MTALRWDITVEAGSFEPEFITITDPDTRQPLDLTQPGFAVSMVVATREQGDGVVLLTLLDDSGVWRRTADGRIYFEPDSDVSDGWEGMCGYHQTELTHPSGHTVRVAEGHFGADHRLAED